MINKSPIYSAIEKILDIFNLTDKVTLYTYASDFDTLWELLDSTKDDGSKIICVLDDGQYRLRWLPLGIWGMFYRSKYNRRLILLGNHEALYPFYIDTFSFDEGVDDLVLNSDDFVVQLLKSADKEVTTALNKEIVKSWQRLIFSYLSAPGDRHAVSNEMAPLILNQALKRLISAIKINIVNTEKPTIGAVISKEKEALFALWDWASLSFFVSERGERNPISDEKLLEEFNKCKMTDIWSLWTNAKFLLIDDQAEMNDYRVILKSALTLLLGNGAELHAEPGLISKDAIKKFHCLFLDLRLTEEDRKIAKYSELPAIKLAIELSREDPSFPIIIFSSTQKREIDTIFNAYPNIITCFRKPGIAGSIESLDGDIALINLFKAIKKALEMIENGVVWRAIEKQKDEVDFHYSANEDDFLIIKAIKSHLKKAFVKVFHHQNYEKAFTFPFSFFEESFTDNDDPSKDKKLREELTNLCRVDTFVEVMKVYKNYHEASCQRVSLSDFVTAKKFSLQHLYMSALSRFRNLGAHGIRDFQEARREAIAVMMIFISAINNKYGNNASESKTIPSEIKSIIFKNKGKIFWHPLVRPFNSNDKDLYRYISDIFGAYCYYANEDDTYNYIYELWKHRNNRNSGAFSAIADAQDNRILGSVVYFDEGEGCGIIQVQRNNVIMKVFVYKSNLASGTRLSKGDRVSFMISKTSNGWRAYDVKQVDRRSRP